MESSLLSALPNLSIGAVSILALVVVTRNFLTHLKERESAMAKSMSDREIASMEQLKERELALRAIEKEVRDTIIGQLTENSQLMSRVVDFLNFETKKRR